jgi:hypothetical protein
LALHIAKRFGHLVEERDVDGMTGLQLLSCNPGAFRREPKKEFLEHIVSYGNSFYQISTLDLLVCMIFIFLGKLHKIFPNFHRFDSTSQSSKTLN